MLLLLLPSSAFVLPPTQLPAAPRTRLFAKDNKSSWLRKLEEEKERRRMKTETNMTNMTKTTPPVPYERAEEWDSRDGKVDMTFEERLRYDSQKEGDKNKQNDNLNNAIKGD
ncbi:hypothetical protein TrLO_g6892 [Triparma laevis f. longispina]|uniref:Uncharacterized protein n=1 Tax=Triparma laevis f. longispina TaxID=1714387 RepID=A0A9W7C4Q1_9STRA|nr:hypothetical protein TrLO_g6892 [Triparma laevis f. longispina]